MSLSGIAATQESIDLYEKKRFEKKEGGIILKINENKIEVEHEFTEDFSGLLTTLPDEEPRYVLYDVPTKNQANLDDLKTVFMFWMPIESPVRLRMHYASTKSVVGNTFRGISLTIQEDDKSVLNLDYLTTQLDKAKVMNRY
ncbi:MAG: hypothetical protein OEZ01_02190 [Candidatus Heimdallarchaeota archaeon]|nr:hypothetical protein [Candidatus Heimdallarchaeota archaeon]MDH5644785.1 hypothetical protein [Candidatus Heimdallarchaeota archaeon]